MAENESDKSGGVKVHHVHMSIDAPHALEQIALDVEELPFGLKLAAKGILEGLVGIAERAAKLKDPVLDKYMVFLHLYELPEDNRMDMVDEIYKKADAQLKKEAEEVRNDCE